MSMKKNILIIGLASIFGIASGLISCSPDYETEFKVETLVVPDKSQAPITFPLLGGEHEIEVQTNVPLDRWSAQSNAEWCKVVQCGFSPDQKLDGQQQCEALRHGGRG